MIASKNNVIIDASKRLEGKIYFVLEFFGRSNRSTDWIINFAIYDSPEIEIGKAVAIKNFTLTDEEVIDMFGTNTINTLSSATGLLAVPLIDKFSSELWGLKVADLDIISEE